MGHELGSSFKIIESVLEVIVGSEEGCSEDQELGVVSVEFKTLFDLVECHLLVAFEHILDSTLIELLGLGPHDLQELDHLSVLRFERMGDPELFISFFNFIN